jgi:hypothetical protein
MPDIDIYRVHDLTTHIVKPWDLTFYRQFPQEKINYIDAGKVLVSDFAHAIANKDIFPDASDGIDVLRDHILRIQNRFRNDTDTAFDEMKKVIKKAHKLAVPAVKGFLEEMYEHCASESGEIPKVLPVIYPVLTSMQGEVSTPETGYTLTTS